jgi:hypothetical protein
VKWGVEEIVEELMASTLGATKLHLRSVNHRDSYFNCKLVFLDLEPVLASKGYRIERAETRQHGRGTPPALRVKTNGSQKLDVEATVKIRLMENDDQYFKHKLVFDDLEETLKKYGFLIAWCSTREQGQHSPLALRVSLA